MALKSGLYWIRCSAGINHIVEYELKKLDILKKCDLKKHRSLFVYLKKEDSSLVKKIKTIDDIYSYVGSFQGIGNTKASIDSLVTYFNNKILSSINPYLKNSSVRVTLSFLGTRNFSRFYVEGKINDVLKSCNTINVLSNENEDKFTKGEKRIRIHIEDDIADFGISVFDKPLHRRPWRKDSYPSQLHPPIAAAMSLLATPKANSTIIDPFCGSGTILIESKNQHPSISHIGYDISKEAISIAKRNVINVGISISFKQQDSLKNFKENGFYIISNPPWGDKHLIEKSNLNLFMRQFSKLIKNSDGAVLLLPENYIKLINNQGFKVKQLFQTRIKGKIAFAVKVDV
ncbi:TRM11 family SAM-dependent methyltransferase [Yeosuana marina]|uniref:TRM11 family SAM-dependent methyltransferase n=1 Tax=Yeosuana marina TaxID=1565536 RepID=UPI0030C7B7E1